MKSLTAGRRGLRSHHVCVSFLVHRGSAPPPGQPSSRPFSLVVQLLCSNRMLLLALHPALTRVSCRRSEPCFPRCVLQCAKNENLRKIPCSHGKGQTPVWMDKDHAENRAGQTAIVLPCLLSNDFVANSKVKLGGVFRSWNL